jgi:anthranilate synthase component 1
MIMYKPTTAEMYSDVITPIMLLGKLKAVSEKCFILESMEDRERWGRWTFLGYDGHPTANNELTIDSSLKGEGLPPFIGGLVGYITYEGEMDLLLFHKIFAFDNLRQKLILIGRDNTDLEEMRRIITHGEPAVIPKFELLTPFKELFSQEEYCDKVKKTQEYISTGEVSQVVLSNLSEADVKGSLFDAYRVIRTINPSPYMFYLSGIFEIAGASPETLIKLTNGELRTFPIGGTRRRGATAEEDKQIEKELLADKKELSEHDMLVTVGKEDLQKISKPDSVKVEDYMAIKRYSHVMHITSAVTGEIREGVSFGEAIHAVLPAGTLSGAPRQRACEIIDALEQNKRGIYGGALGYISFTGDMDFCISIRLAFKKDGKVYVRSGAGVIAESVPENEYEECVNKAKAVITALDMANGGINNE